MNIIIRQETKKDYDIVCKVVKKAFENAPHKDGTEHILVEKLRKSDSFIPELSLVAVYDDKIVGHVLFTRVTIGDEESLALAPVSVLPEYQNLGIGSKLILEGHRIAKELGFKSAIVLGDPKYYSRFGYRPASNWNIKAPFDVPEGYYMAVELVEEGLKGVSGIVNYAKEFFE